jgi:hypothetical protein
MRLSDFIVLAGNEKEKVVLHEGVLIGKRFNEEEMVFLFQLDNYYVETYCNRQRKAIESFQAFDNTDLLHPYLEKIRLEDLLN